MSDHYVSKKYNRQKRINDKVAYIDSYFIEIKNGGSVLDLGPGPGEFMEVCREYGLDIYGIDAKEFDSEMGNEYLRLSQLMAERQQLNILYDGVLDLINKNGALPFKDKSFDFINCQGAIEQIFKVYLEGEPHIKHKNCNLLSWKIDDDFRKEFRMFLLEIYRLLKEGGICLVYGNGAKNVQAYDIFFREMISVIDGFEMMKSIDYRLHKFKKV